MSTQNGAAPAGDDGAAGIEDQQQQQQPGGEGEAAAQQDEQQGQQAEGGGEEAPAPKSSRDAIYSRHRDIRARAAAEDPERMAAVAIMAGQGEEAQPGDGGAPAGEGGEQQQGAEGGREKELALDKRMHKLTVEGKEIEVPEDQILEAGRRTLQKDHSADLKLRRAASAEQLAAERLAEADQIRKQALENSGRLPSSGAGHDDASSHPSDQDAGESTEAIALAAASQARDVLFDEGDPEKAAQVILASSRKTVVEATNRMFTRDFNDITGDTELFKRAAAMMKTEMAGKDFASFPVIATRIGNQLRAEKLGQQVHQAGAEDGQQPPAEEQQAAPGAARSRVATKVRLPAVPSRATTKAPDTRSPAPQRKSPSQIVHDMKVARGQARAT